LTDLGPNGHRYKAMRWLFVAGLVGLTLGCGRSDLEDYLDETPPSGDAEAGAVRDASKDATLPPSDATLPPADAHDASFDATTDAHPEAS
jgi:hypothetical protein